MFSALGELIGIIFYLILLIPIAVMLVRLFYDNKRNRKNYVWLVFSTLPLLLFSYSQFNSHRNSELEYVGKYQLDTGSICDGGVIELKSDNTFIIMCDEKILESGKWNYREGSDYWIVDIGEHGQLGSGNYKYSLKMNE